LGFSAPLLAFFDRRAHQFRFPIGGIGRFWLCGWLAVFGVEDSFRREDDAPVFGVPLSRDLFGPQPGFVARFDMAAPFLPAALPFADVSRIPLQSHLRRIALNVPSHANPTPVSKTIFS
jgi:hypothetical protein